MNPDIRKHYKITANQSGIQTKKIDTICYLP